MSEYQKWAFTFCGLAGMQMMPALMLKRAILAIMSIDESSSTSISPSSSMSGFSATVFLVSIHHSNKAKPFLLYMHSTNFWEKVRYSKVILVRRAHDQSKNWIEKALRILLRYSPSFLASTTGACFSGDLFLVVKSKARFSMSGTRWTAFLYFRMASNNFPSCSNSTPSRKSSRA